MVLFLLQIYQNLKAVGTNWTNNRLVLLNLHLKYFCKFGRYQSQLIKNPSEFPAKIV